jgi:hypothetical protein
LTKGQISIDSRMSTLFHSLFAARRSREQISLEAIVGQW